MAYVQKTPPRDALGLGFGLGAEYNGSPQQSRWQHQHQRSHLTMDADHVRDNAEEALSMSDASSSFVVSEIVNPDGSVTQRRLVLNADGSDSVIEEHRQRCCSNDVDDSNEDSSNASVRNRQSIRPPRPTLKTSNTANSDAVVTADAFRKTASQAYSYNFNYNDDLTNLVPIRSSPLRATGATTTMTALSKSDTSVSMMMMGDKKEIPDASSSSLSSSSSSSSSSTLQPPALAAANSWDTSTQSSGTSNSRRSKSSLQERQSQHTVASGGGEVSERTGHELRRQRLARARKVPPALDREVDEQLYSPSRFDTLNSINRTDFDKDDAIFSGKTFAGAAAAATDNRLSSPPRPKRTTAGKHVAFLEPTAHNMSDQTEDLTSSFESVNTRGSTTDDVTSMGYPLLDVSGSTIASEEFASNVDAAAIVTSFEGSQFSNAQSTTSSSDGSTGLFTDLENKRQQESIDQGNRPSSKDLMSSSPGQIKYMTRQASQNYHYDQYRGASPGKGTDLVTGCPVDPERFQAYSAPNTSLDEILGPITAPNLLPSMSTSTTSSQTSKSSSSRENNMTIKGYEEQKEIQLGVVRDKPHKLHTATVQKETAAEKVGIIVGIQHLDGEERLVVSRISSSGRLANSGIEPGDIIVSINGTNFLNHPSSQTALDIVKNAPRQIRIVYKKGEGQRVAYSSSKTTTSPNAKAFNVHPIVTTTSEEETSTSSSLKSGQKVHESPLVREKMSADGSLLVSKDAELNEPYPVLTSESWKLSGAIVIGVKKAVASQDAGLRMSVKETPLGRALVVSHISSSSPFAATPLRPGDIILSINSVSLRENADVVDAYAALGKSGKEVTMVAKKAENSLMEFLAERIVGSTAFGGIAPVKAKAAVPTNFGLPCPSPVTMPGSEDKGNSSGGMEFDEDSYGSALVGYNSSKSVFVSKSDPTENIGIELICLNTEWGKLLTVSSIVPDSLVSESTDIEVGDAILSINGVNFREYPNVSRAMSLMNQARQMVYIEYQKLASFAPAVPVSKVQLDSERKEVAEDRRPDYSKERLTIVSLSDVESQKYFDVRPKSESTDGYLQQNSRNPGSGSALRHNARGQAAKVDPQSSNPRTKKIWVTVTKVNKNQQLGISLAAINNSLVVTRVLPSGMLCGAPVLPGDEVLSINKCNFRGNPNVVEANDLIHNSLVVEMEILKTGYKVDPDLFRTNGDDSFERTKYCLGGNFFCARPQRLEQKGRTFSINGSAASPGPISV